MGCIGGCFSCIGNTIYYLVNFIFMLIGIALISGGTILIVSFDCTVEKLIYEFMQAIGAPSYDQSVSISDTDIGVNTAAIVMLSVGGFFVLLGMMSFLGLAIKAFEKIAVFFYIIFTIVLLGFSIFVIVFFALPEKPESIDLVNYALKDLIMPRYKPTTSDTTQFTIEGALMDMVQSGFHCCGVSSYKDYEVGGIGEQVAKNTWDMTLWGGIKADTIKVPPTCCRTKDEIAKYPTDTVAAEIPVDVKYFPTTTTINGPSCYRNTPTAEQVHTARGCTAMIYQAASDFNTEIIISASVATAVFLILIICLFVKLCSSDKKHSKNDDVEIKAPSQPTPQPVAAVPVNQPMYPGQQAYPGYQSMYPAYPGYPGQQPARN